MYCNGQIYLLFKIIVKPFRKEPYKSFKMMMLKMFMPVKIYSHDSSTFNDFNLNFAVDAKNAGIRKEGRRVS